MSGGSPERGTATQALGKTQLIDSPLMPRLKETLDIAALAADWAGFVEHEGPAYILGGDGRLVSLAVSDGGRHSGLLSHIHVQDRVDFMASLSDCAFSGEPQSRKIRLACWDAPHRYQLHEMLFRAHPLSCGKDRAPGVLVVGKNIETQLSEKQMLEHQRDELEKADLAKTRFLANMSHELRTPLNSIIGFSEVLRSGVMGELKPEKRDEYVGIINDSAQHLLSVLNDILNISKIEAGKYQINAEPFNLKKLVDAVLAMFDVSASEKQITLTCHYGEDLPEITADSRAIKQVLINLLSNAIKFTPQGGSVSVSVGRSGRKVSIMVEDTGIGLTPGQLQNLGKPFYQADADYSRNYEGTGLGLSIVDGLVGLHQGSMNVESTVGEGTRVCVELPINSGAKCQVPADCDAQVIKLSSIKTESRPAPDFYEETGS